MDYKFIFRVWPNEQYQSFDLSFQQADIDLLQSSISESGDKYGRIRVQKSRKGKWFAHILKKKEQQFRKEEHPESQQSQQQNNHDQEKSNIQDDVLPF